ncbi:MAG: MerR family transcriptional regulator [Vicingaceae bacterium]|nr:MerR family transcriptional regulator [Vicingaceae bacterium]
MAKYKISDLEKLSGVKSHTIRIWEQRYKVLIPLRTDTNIRYYDDKQLKKLLNIVSLINSGDKISKISKLTEVEFNDKIKALDEKGGLSVKEEMLTNQLISSGLAYDETGFEKAFSNSILSFGLMESYKRVFYPMLVKLGFLWSASELSPSQEHFVSNLIKQKIFAAIDALKPPSIDSEKWVLFLPEGEMHDIGLLVANFILRSKSVNVIYLGDNVPIKNLYQVSESIKPTHYLTFAVRQNQQKMINDYLFEMQSKFNDPNIYICCDSILEEKLKLSKKQHAITNFEAFQKIID